ncbi:hypothetical protein PVAND_012977 [Polypedilum vanderplanki]|uniref:serine--tRNA ligase n=1 Tax=Polypedilum vanderplanki TaxID=319348 RepID=A0A9J6CP27_POLVA|nr:hypothetical protein PVAND_012977 [Polypedilum vanderplanki]
MNCIRQLRLLRTYNTSYYLRNKAASKCQDKIEERQHKFQLSEPILNEKYLLDPKNAAKISENSLMRKGIGDIYLVHEINNKLKDESLNPDERRDLESQLKNELKKIPNDTHPAVRNYGEEPKVVALFNKEPEFKHKVYEFSEICRKLNILRTDHLGNFAGHKSYYLMNDLAELEQALIRYTLSEILQHGFNLISVPDILPAEVIKSCGMQTDGDRTQVYRLLPSNLCLSGTSEMALAGYFAGSKLSQKELPIKVTAVSRCFRAETSGTTEERGIYRVHQFTKVEMFSVCSPAQSEDILNEFKEIEIALFNKLGLHFKLLDMPPHELGAPAYRKYDIETFMPGRKIWGEISSCSNCTDYQSRRLNITIDESAEFAHTVNGTACAIPRMLIAIIESFQNEKGFIEIPKVLQPYMKKDKIVKQKVIPELKLIKHAIKS